MAKRQAAHKSEAPAASAAATLPDDGDKDRDDVNKSLDDLRAEREKWEKKFKSIEGWRKRLQAAQAAVARAQAEFEEADAERKRAKASVDTAIAKELELVSKFVHGEQMLPFDPSEHPEQTAQAPAAQPATGATAANDHGAAQPIESLLAKHLKKIVGKDVFDAAKSRGEPLGLSDKQIETLEGADIKTVGDLEKRIREDAWFLKNLHGFGEKAIDRLTDTLMAFRAVYPVPAVPETPEPSATEQPAEKPADPQPEEWEQSEHQLRELIKRCDALLDQEIPDDGKQFCRSVAMEAEEMLANISEHKSVTAEQWEAIRNWCNGVSNWQQDE